MLDSPVSIQQSLLGIEVAFDDCECRHGVAVTWVAALSMLSAYTSKQFGHLERGDRDPVEEASTREALTAVQRALERSLLGEVPPGE